MHISFSQTFAAAILLALSVGCGPSATSHDYVSVESSAGGELDYNVETDGGVKNSELGSANYVQPFPTCAGAVPCKALVAWYGKVEVRFDPPPSTGTHDLADLQGVVCQNARTGAEKCAPLVGRIEVTEMVSPCVGDACGRFEAELVLEPSKTTKAPAVWGTARLSYSESMRTMTTGGGGDGCSNFKGG